MTAFFATLEHDALLAISGPDSLKFLQGQTTCDTRKLDAGHSLQGAYCNPKGRVVCDFLLAQLGPEQWALRMQRDLRPVAAETFGKYIVFSKATLTPAEDWQVYGCWGAGAAAVLAALAGAMPAGAGGSVAGDGLLLVQCDDHGERFELWLHERRAAAALAALADNLAPGDPEAWRALQVRAGIARLSAAASGDYLVQDLNYDLTGRVSFNKGCYTGQEIVARLHYLGKAKRRLFLATLAGEAPPAGSALADSDGKPAGTVINSAGEGDGAVCLVNTAAEALAAGLHLEGQPERQLVAAALPYPVEGA